MAFRDLLSLASIVFACSVNLFRPKIRRPWGSAEQRNVKVALLVGNGPSAGEDLKALNLSRYVKRVGVNFLAGTDWFSSVKPDYYFLQDAYWFETVEASSRQKVEETFAGLNEKVSWDLKLFVPARFFDQLSKSGRISNPQISIMPITAASLKGGDVTYFSYRPLIYKTLIFKLWSAGVLPVPATNIVSTALFELINSGYKKIDVVGVDMTMAQDLSLNQEGKLQFVPSHFYGKAQAAEPHKGSERDSVARAYEWLAIKFRVFDLLADYAVYRGATVTNLSSVTLLDSFPWKPVTHRTEDTPGHTAN